MYQFHHGTLPCIFSDFFNKVTNVHDYNTRLSSELSYALPKIRTNYGIFNIRYCGSQLWNSIEEFLKLLDRHVFKKRLKLFLIASY